MRTTGLLLLLATLPYHALANDLDYSIKNGKFYTSSGKIPEGCMGQFITKLNGDATVASIFLGRASMRGCIDANLPYPGGEENTISYRIVEGINMNRYKLIICESIDGSMRHNCDNVIVKFRSATYTTPEGVKKVLALDKIGEW